MNPWSFGPSQVTGVGDQNQQMITASNYPSFPNAAGVGTQTAYQGGSQAPQPVDSEPSSTSPWLFQGAALAR